MSKLVKEERKYLKCPKCNDKKEDKNTVCGNCGHSPMTYYGKIDTSFNYQRLSINVQFVKIVLVLIRLQIRLTKAESVRVVEVNWYIENQERTKMTFYELLTKYSFNEIWLHLNLIERFFVLRDYCDHFERELANKYLEYENIYNELLKLHGTKLAYEGVIGLEFEFLEREFEIEYGYSEEDLLELFELAYSSANKSKLPQKTDIRKIAVDIVPECYYFSLEEVVMPPEDDIFVFPVRTINSLEEDGTKRTYAIWVLDDIPWDELIDMPVWDEVIEKYGGLFVAAELLYEVKREKII